MSYSEKIIEQAKTLYDLGAPIEHIRQECDLPNRRIIYTWIKRFKWNASTDTYSLIVKTSRRLNWLIDRDEKSKADWCEVSNLGDLLMKLEKASAYASGETRPSNRGRKPNQKTGTGRKKKPKKNDVSHITTAMLDEIEAKVFYKHQKIWLEAGRNPKTNLMRFILKARQIGATFTFAWEALRNAIETGHNQIFISSTKDQAKVFKSYIYQLALEHFDLELTGDPIKLVAGKGKGIPEIHFLSPNSFANSRSGDVYFDEVFYTRSFDKMKAVAAPMATLDGFKETYFGAPTAESHTAFKLWSGEAYKKQNPNTNINIKDHTALLNGRLDPDNIWRCVCTVDSAIEMGWDKVNIERLRIKTPDPDQFENIYRCKFIDDSYSVFNLNTILSCGVDTYSWYPEYNAGNTNRPAYNNPVSVGYDPAGDGDNAAIAVVSYPNSIYEKFKLYEKQKYRGMIASAQAQKMVDIHRRYNVDYLDIDKSGPGLYIPGEVQSALREAEIDQPRTVAKQYSVESKARMVQKAINVISQRRFEYDENDQTLPIAFMGIRQGTTPKSNQITYYSNRTEAAGHGDEAWAVMHAFMCEPLNPPKHANNSSSVCFSD